MDITSSASIAASSSMDGICILNHAMINLAFTLDPKFALNLE